MKYQDEESVKRISKSAKNADKEILRLHTGRTQSQRSSNDYVCADMSESMKEVLKIKKGRSDVLNRKIFEHASEIEKERHNTYFYPGRSVACALIAMVVLLMGGIGISHAAGVGPVQMVLDHFTRRDENVIDQKEYKGKSDQDSGHTLTVNEHYLDALGNGYLAFSLTKKDGGKERDLALGTDLKAYYTTAEKNAAREFASYGIEPVYSEQKDSLDGVQLSLYGTKFPAEGGEIVIKMGKERFTFSDLEVTQPHYYEWESKKGNIFLSSVGMIADGNTNICDYISSIIGIEKDTEAIATVVYKDGHQDTLQLLNYCGAEGNHSNRAVIQFSPWTELQKHLEEGWSWEEVKEEWKEDFSIYTFKLDEISTIEIGGIVLDVRKASYR